MVAEKMVTATAEVAKVAMMVVVVRVEARAGDPTVVMAVMVVVGRAEVRVEEAMVEVSGMVETVALDREVRSRRNRCPDRRERIVLPARHRHSFRRSNRHTSESKCWVVMAAVLVVPLAAHTSHLS